MRDDALQFVAVQQFQRAERDADGHVIARVARGEGVDAALAVEQGRYQLGLGSIVELSQAQLQQTDAAIGYVNSQYQYRLALSTLNFEIGVQP